MEKDKTKSNEEGIVVQTKDAIQVAKENDPEPCKAKIFASDKDSNEVANDVVKENVDDYDLEDDAMLVKRSDEIGMEKVHFLVVERGTAEDEVGYEKIVGSKDAVSKAHQENGKIDNADGKDEGGSSQEQNFFRQSFLSLRTADRKLCRGSKQ